MNKCKFQVGDVVKIKTLNNTLHKPAGFVFGQKYKILAIKPYKGAKAYEGEGSYWISVENYGAAKPARNGWTDELFELDAEYLVTKIITEVLSDPNPQ